MLTNVIEGASRMVSFKSFNYLNSTVQYYLKTKCHQYWPELGQTITYGSYHITCVDVISVGDYDKRYLQLSKVNFIQ